MSSSSQKKDKPFFVCCQSTNDSKKDFTLTEYPKKRNIQKPQLRPYESIDGSTDKYVGGPTEKYTTYKNQQKQQCITDQIIKLNSRASLNRTSKPNISKQLQSTILYRNTQKVTNISNKLNKSQERFYSPPSHLGEFAHHIFSHSSQQKPDYSFAPPQKLVKYINVRPNVRSFILRTVHQVNLPIRPVQHSSLLLKPQQPLISNFNIHRETTTTFNNSKNVRKPMVHWEHHPEKLLNQTSIMTINEAISQQNKRNLNGNNNSDSSFVEVEKVQSYLVKKNENPEEEPRNINQSQ